MRHNWSEPVRLLYSSHRMCQRCALVKVTHKEGVEVWIEWRKADGSKSTETRTPACEDVDAMSEVA